MIKGLMVGSSIFEQWSTAQGQHHYFELVNYAIGGTTADYWSEEISTKLGKADFQFVLLYCGSNDFNQGFTKKAILASLKQCIEQVRARLGSHAVCYCSIMKAPQKLELGLADDIDYVNQAIFSFLTQDELGIDMDEALGAKYAHDYAFLYQEDKLHLTDEAYCRIKDYLFPKLEAWL